MSQRSVGSPALGGSAGRTAAHPVGGRPAETPPPFTRVAFCPHCQLPVADEAEPGWPPRAVRCPHCRLLIGSGRGLAEPAGEPGARGTAAGVFAGEARRQEGGVQASGDEVREAIRLVAADMGMPPERLLMVDYQQQIARRGGLPPLTAVLAAFGTWKNARREAAQSG